MNAHPPSEPVFESRFGHEILLVTQALARKAIPNRTVGNQTWFGRFPVAVLDELLPAWSHWQVLVPPEYVAAARDTVASLPVPHEPPRLVRLSSREVRTGTRVLASLVILLSLAFLAMTLLLTN
jgi:hypothetical protein